MRTIDADALKKIFDADEEGKKISYNIFIVNDKIDSAPTIEERKTGKWIEKDGWDGDVYYDCSACGESWTTIEGTPWDNDMNYCPHCGAKMEGVEE